MNTISSTFWCTFALIHLFGGVCFCSQLLGYARHATNYSMPGAGLLYLQGVSRERCFAKCSTILECYFVSYDTMSGDCMLSPLGVMLTGKIPAAGWSLFRFKPPCTFVTIGSHDLAICDHLVVKTYADNACASFGSSSESWRLLEPRTLDMYWEIADYLNANNVYGSVWVGVEYHNNDWQFPDGSSLDLVPENSYDVNGSKMCLRMRHGSSAYKYADQPCKEEYNYICEKI